MRIYHLSDLHFGKSIYGLSMLDNGDQRFWVDRFIDLCSREKPDAVVIAGDVYDRASPSGDAVELLDFMLTRLADMEIAVMLISGNHDSGQRISFGRSFLARQQIHIAGSVKKDMDHVSLKDEYGEVVFWLMPYLFPDQVSRLLEDEEIRTYDQAVKSLLACQDIDWDKRNVLIAHQNVIAHGKEAERGGSESMVGGVGQVDYDSFDGFEYVALGHIHSSYSVGRPEVKYAGTPLCYHLAETRQKDKGPVLVELKDKGDKTAISTVAIKPLHKMRFFKGKKQEVMDLLEKDKGRNEYVGITLSDERITPETDRYFRGMLEKRDSILVELISTYSSFNGTAANSATEISQKALEDLFSDLYKEQSGGNPPDEDEYDLMHYVAEIVRNQDCKEAIRQSDVDKIIANARKGED